MKVIEADEAEILEETTNDMPLGEFNLEEWLTNRFDELTTNNKSGVITEALILAELAEDKQKLRAVQRANPEVLDRYFEQINYQALVSKHGDTVKKRAKTGLKNFFKEKALPFGIGAGTGIVLTKLFK